MDYKIYGDLKAKGLITLTKVGNAYACSIKQFDQNTGVEKTAIVESIDISILQVRKATLEAEATQIEILIADCLALD